MKDKTIAITRSPDDATEFIDLAKSNHATPLALPTIRLTSKGKKIVNEFLESISVNDPDYCIFMSSKAVQLLFNTARKSNMINKLKLAVANTSVVSVGPKTSAALNDEGIKVNFEPSEIFSSVGVGEIFTQISAVGKKALIPRSAAATPFLKQLLEKIGVCVYEIYLYDVCAFDDTAEWNEFRVLFANDTIHGMIFTSASSVRAFFEIMERDRTRTQILDGLDRITIVSIGPFTSAELEKFNVQYTTAATHTVAGAFDTLKSII